MEHHPLISFTLGLFLGGVGLIAGVRAFDALNAWLTRA